MSDDPKDWETATRLVRGGSVRSPFGEGHAGALP